MEQQNLTDCAFVECAKLSPDVFDRFYTDVLQPSFPPEELEDVGVVRAEYLGSPTESAGLIAMRGGEPVGGALGELFPDSRVILLAYLAVRADQRGTGLGTELLKRAVPAWQGSFSPAAMVAEVEDPRFHGSGPHGDPVARLRFYDRAGGTIVPIDYVQPRVRPGSPRVHGIFLICLEPGRESTPRNILLAFLDEYMESAEGPDTRQHDPEYLKLRHQVETSPDEIPLWPLSQAATAPTS